MISERAKFNHDVRKTTKQSNTLVESATRVTYLRKALTLFFGREAFDHAQRLGSVAKYTAALYSAQQDDFFG